MMLIMMAWVYVKLQYTHEIVVSLFSTKAANYYNFDTGQNSDLITSLEKVEDAYNRSLNKNKSVANDGVGKIKLCFNVVPLLDHYIKDNRILKGTFVDRKKEDTEYVELKNINDHDDTEFKCPMNMAEKLVNHMFTPEITKIHVVGMIMNNPSRCFKDEGKNIPGSILGDERDGACDRFNTEWVKVENRKRQAFMIYKNTNDENYGFSLHIGDPKFLARLIGHELGHLFDFKHYNNKSCKCADKKLSIMTTVNNVSEHNDFCWDLSEKQHEYLAKISTENQLPTGNLYTSTTGLVKCN